MKNLVQRLTDRLGGAAWALLAIAFSLLTIAMSAALDRTVQPLIPAQLFGAEAPATRQAVLGGRPVDFVFRPLFWPSRAPIESQQPEVIEEVSVPSDVADPEVLEGVKLVGVFASGDVKGGILQSEDAERSRLYLGESLSGWQLTEVGQRSVTFMSGDNVSSTLQLAVVSELPVPPTAFKADGAVNDEEVVAATGQPDSSAPAASARRESDPMTFESIDKRKRAQRVEPDKAQSR